MKWPFKRRAGITCVKTAPATPQAIEDFKYSEIHMLAPETIDSWDYEEIIEPIKVEPNPDEKYVKCFKLFSQAEEKVSKRNKWDFASFLFSDDPSTVNERFISDIMHSIVGSIEQDWGIKMHSFEGAFNQKYVSSKFLLNLINRYITELRETHQKRKRSNRNPTYYKTAFSLLNESKKLLMRGEGLPCFAGDLSNLRPVIKREKAIIRSKPTPNPARPFSIHTENQP